MGPHRYRGADEVRPLLAHRHERHAEHAHEHGVARVHMHDRVHLGVVLVDRGVDLHLETRHAPWRAFDHCAVEITNDHVLAANNRQHVDRVAPALYDEPVRLAWDTHAHAVSYTHLTLPTIYSV